MIKNLAIASGILLSSIGALSQTQWPAVKNTARPWTRWWWMGSAVDGKNITEQLKQYNGAGIGGVEVVPIYGAKGYESSYIDYLSPKWMKMLDTTVLAASQLGMGVDVSVGTGWPIGGPQVTINDAATKLIVQRYTLEAGQQLAESITINDKKQTAGTKLIALMAYASDGTVKDISNELTAEGKLQWKPTQGSWEIIAAFSGKTLQKVKRAAPGGEGYTLDHFSASSLNNYLDATSKAYNHGSHGIRAFYNDSYEVYGADWTPDFLTEFEKRRDYSLKPYLRQLTGKDSNDIVRRVKSDYRETMADLMYENFATNFTKWSHKQNAKNINQAHGSPGNLLDLYGAVDIAEAETFGSSQFAIPGLRRDPADVRNVDPDPVMLQFASSASHAMGHNLTSSETFTWLTEHFKTSWSQCKPELEQVFLSGVNHVFFHGTTYSPANIAWPGWLFYASVNFVPANSLWPHLKGLNSYIARCQSILQLGKPANDVAIYWPVYDAWNNNKGLDMPLKVHDVDEWLHPTSFYKNVGLLKKQGYSADFTSDKMLLQSSVKNNLLQVTDSGSQYKAIIVPACGKMPVSTLQKLIALAEQGCTVIFEKLPEDVPGLNHLAERRKELTTLKESLQFESAPNECKWLKKGKGSIVLSANIPAALSLLSIEAEAIASTGLQFIKRENGNDTYYYIVNHTANDIDRIVPINATGKQVLIMNPLTGEEGLAAITHSKEKEMVRIQIKAGEALFLKITASNITAKQWPYKEKSKTAYALQGPWDIHFTAGGPTLPAPRKENTLRSWTEWNDTALQNFSGTAVYTTQFRVDKKTANEYLLSLGQLCESGKVWVNGKEAGLVWALPFEIKIGHLLKQGNNEIKIEVANLMANRIRYMDRNNIQWRNYHEINFVNINYKNFDASVWPLQPSGLLGPVNITEIETVKP